MLVDDQFEYTAFLRKTKWLHSPTMPEPERVEHVVNIVQDVARQCNPDGPVDMDHVPKYGNFAHEHAWRLEKGYPLFEQYFDSLNNGPGLRRCWEQHPQVHFHFELMRTLNNEFLNATSAENMFAQHRGISRDSQLEKLLIQWDAKSGLGQLMPAKRMLDTFYTKPEDLNNRKECTVYAMTMFSALTNTYASLHDPEHGHTNSPIVLPVGLLDTLVQ